jgi:hypothetical protein
MNAHLYQIHVMLMPNVLTLLARLHAHVEMDFRAMEELAKISMNAQLTANSHVMRMRIVTIQLDRTHVPVRLVILGME